MNNRTVLVIYHRVDCDGLASMMIAKDYYTKKGFCVEKLGWNYGDEVPGIKELLEKYSSVVMVDLSFPPQYMKELKELGKGRFTWIDHHQTALLAAESEGYSDLPGIRQETGKAACELVWSYYNPDLPVPRFIKLLGQYDTWRKSECDWEGEILPLQYSIREKLGLKASEWEKDWDNLLEDEEILDWYIETGKSIYSYQSDLWKSWVKNYAFPVLVDGKYKGICMLSPMFGSSCYASVLEDYEIFIIVNKKSSGQIAIGMYKEPESAPDFKCGEYLSQFNPENGGHACAGGGIIGKEVFKRLVFDGEI